MECLVRDTGYRSESAEVDTAGRTFSLTVLLFNDTFRYVSFLRKRDISLLAVTVRERSANPVEFRSQQVRSGGEKKAFWCRAGCPSSSSKSVYSKHPVQPSLCVREMAPGFFISGGFSLGSVQYEYGRSLAMEPNLQPNPLETDPIPKLIVRYAVPTSLTLMVNYLYNIVDQIFVGQGVGITGMAATNIAFPLTILVNAVALMAGRRMCRQYQSVPGSERAAGGGQHHQSRPHPDLGQRSAGRSGLRHLRPADRSPFRRDVDCLCRVSVLICAPSHGGSRSSSFVPPSPPLSGRTAPRST